MRERGLALQLELARGREHDGAPDGERRVLADQPAPGRRRRLEPRRDVDGVAGDGPALGGGLAVHDLARVYPDPQAKVALGQAKPGA